MRELFRCLFNPVHPKAFALARHPEAKEKIGAGVKDFSVRKADYGTKCFWMNRGGAARQVLNRPKSSRRGAPSEPL
jgi:hypothetical protein